MKGDKFYFSPDAGQLVERGGFYYTEDGYVMPSTSTIRMMSIAEFSDNYADWSDEKRLKVRKKFERECRARKAKERQLIRERDALVEQAKGKLTAEEFDAVMCAGYAEGRGY